MSVTPEGKQAGRSDCQQARRGVLTRHHAWLLMYSQRSFSRALPLVFCLIPPRAWRVITRWKGLTRGAKAWSASQHPSHPNEALLDELRQRQLTAAGRTELRERVTAEHTSAHPGYWQGRRARYRGDRKNLFDNVCDDVTKPVSGCPSCFCSEQAVPYFTPSGYCVYTSASWVGKTCLPSRAMRCKPAITCSRFTK